MSEQPAGEKSFAPTEKRLRDAAKKGNVLRSREVATAIVLLTGALWLKLGGPWLLTAMEGTATRAFAFDRGMLEDFRADRLMADLAWMVAPPILSLGVLTIVATLVVQLAYGEGRWVTANILPKASRMNPIAGLGRMFGLNGLIELGKSLAKLALLGTIAWFWGRTYLATLMTLGRGELTGQLAAAWDAAAMLLLMLSAGLVIIALIDWPIQYVRRMQKLRMTSQELRDEHKETEGSPERKAAIRQRQRDLARGGVAVAMKKAQFVLTNPTHFAVAMAYDPALAPAPFVVAKGRGDKALAMREIAAEMGVPALEYPLLARSVYFTTRENQMIRA
ncbi:MAG: EscU/YscU/HrcU family type III secretion system export apparatus switch protein, partial [Alteraurantiacibacter sp.]|nr:EscU/YscU/HrcU family type III secretion system export apparatus switch protein [Alteraurantiacibacter sp.]